MSVPLSAKFYNQIYRPAYNLLQTLAAHPFAIEPESNVLLHQFEGLTLHVNHFAEKNDLSFLNKELTNDDQFRDLANSIKHIRRNPEDQVTCESALIFEVKEEKFRFVRNTIVSRYDNKNETFDAIDKLCKTIEKYFSFVGISIDRMDIPESNYPPYLWAIAYQLDELAAITKSTRLITVKKEGDNYIKFDPKEIKFLGLDKALIGQNPVPHFPEM